MELEKPDFEFTPEADRRPTIPEPPPVRLVAIEDMKVTATTAEAEKLDGFYVGLLKFEREPSDAGVVYRAENVRLRFELTPDAHPKEDMRAVGIEVPSLRDLELLLVDQEVSFVKEPGIYLGHMTFLLRDPAGNWVRISETVRIL